MKKNKNSTLLIALICLLSLGLYSQKNSGIVIYSVMNNPEELEETLSHMDPKMRSFVEEKMRKDAVKRYVLLFNDFQSIYKEDESVSIETRTNNSWSPYGIDISVFKNFKENQLLEEKDLMGKTFIVNDLLPKYDWKVTNDSKQIGDYICYKAICVIPVTEKEKEDYEIEVLNTEKSSTQFFEITKPQETILTAWFTQDVPVNHGPSLYHGLPGLILEITDGKNVYLCSKLELKRKELSIKLPKGQRIAKLDYEILVDKKVKEIEEVDSN